MPVIADACYNRVKGYSRKYTIGYIDNTRNKHKNTPCDYMKVFIFGFFCILNSFLTTEPSYCLNISKHSQLYTARFCPFYLDPLQRGFAILIVLHFSFSEVLNFSVGNLAFWLGCTGSLSSHFAFCSECCRDI
jgi:hypothetical protein